MDYNIRNNLQFIRDLLLEDLRHSARSLAQTSLSIKEYRQNGNFHVNSYFRKFGSWNAALEMAGLETESLVFISESQLMENMKLVSRKLGRIPELEDMVKPHSKYDRHTYCYRYGSWSKALLAFRDYIIEQAGKKRTYKSYKKREPISKALRYEVLKRDKFRCKCGRTPANDPDVILHVDHKIPVSKGGKNTMDNLQTLCDYCNFGKGSKSWDEL